MKVLICIPCLLTGGTEIQTLNLVQALVSGGHQVTTVCYFEHQASMVANYRRAGSEVILLQPEGKRIFGWKAVLFLWKGLKQAVKDAGPDVVHVQYMAPGAIPILLLRMMGVSNILTTAHTFADIYPSLRLIHFIQRHCVKAFTCITERAERSFFGSSALYTENYPLKKHNHFTIYNALPAYIQIRTDHREFTSMITLGVVSRLEPIKGMDLIIPTFAKVKEKFANLQLLVVGDGSQKELMTQQAVDYHVEQSVEWAGRQEYNTIQSYYDRIDILCMPSRSEGFGLTAIEGMARGCIVVASNVGGLPEIVVDGKVGVLHPTEDVTAIASSISSLLSDRNTMKEMSKNAMAYADSFTMKRYSHIFNDLYNNI